MNAQLCDNLLNEIYNRMDKENYASGSLELAKFFEVSESKIIDAVNEIKKYNYHFLMRKDGFSDNQLVIHPVRESRPDVLVFLESGGFTNLEKLRQEEIIRTEMQRSREERLSELQIRDLLRLPGEARKTRQLSLAAILISIAALSFEIWKNLFSNK